MRKLNALEKNIVDRIVDYHNKGILSNYASIIDHLLQDKDIVLDFQNRSAQLRADIQFHEQGQLIPVVEKISVELVITVNLLRDLEQNGYLVTLLEAPTHGQHRYGQLIEGNAFISYRFVDPPFVDLLLDYSLKSIIVGQSLLDFVKNGYQTDEEKTNRRNLSIAVCALVISTILNLVSLIYNHYEVKYAKQQVEQSVTIDKQQIDTIRGDLKELRSTIEQSKNPKQRTPSNSRSGKK